jgi:DNA-binding response OmpR family regulator
VSAFGSLDELRQSLAALAGHEPPDLLISDYRLPDGTGLQAIAEARARWPGMAALLITADTAPRELARLAEAGVPVLHKPFRAETLLAQIQALSSPVA